MNHFDVVDFSECHSEEVMFLLTLSLYLRQHVHESLSCWDIDSKQYNENIIGKRLQAEARINHTGQWVCENSLIVLFFLDVQRHLNLQYWLWSLKVQLI